MIITTSRYRISNFEGAATPVFLLQVFPRKIVRSWRIRFAICGKEARLPALLAARKRFGLQQVELWEEFPISPFAMIRCTVFCFFAESPLATLIDTAKNRENPDSLACWLGHGRSTAAQRYRRALWQDSQAANLLGEVPSRSAGCGAFGSTSCGGTEAAVSWWQRGPTRDTVSRDQAWPGCQRWSMMKYDEVWWSSWPTWTPWANCQSRPQDTIHSVYQTFVPGALIAQVEFLMPMKKTAKILKQRQAKGQLHCCYRSVADSCAKAGIGRHVQTGYVNKIPVIPANCFPNVVFYVEAAASGSDSATTLEERAPWSRVQFGDEQKESRNTWSPKVLRP